MVSFHRDFCAENIRWANGRIAAVSDWRNAQLDIVARDLARAAWELGHDDDYNLDIVRTKAFLSGYRVVQGAWDPDLADILIPLMRVHLRDYARTIRGGDAEYSASLYRAFARLAHQDAGPLFDV